MKMVSGIPECVEKYLLKLRIQQDIVNTCFSINQTNITQGLMPLNFTNPPISIQHSGPFFLQRPIAASNIYTHLIYFYKEHTGIV